MNELVRSTNLFVPAPQNFCEKRLDIVCAATFGRLLNGFRGCLVCDLVWHRGVCAVSFEGYIGKNTGYRRRFLGADPTVTGTMCRFQPASKRNLSHSTEFFERGSGGSFLQRRLPPGINKAYELRIRASAVGAVGGAGADRVLFPTDACEQAYIAGGISEFLHVQSGECDGRV